MFFGIIFFCIIVWILISIVFWTIRNGISPMPTSAKVKRCLLENLPEIKNGNIYELGSAWGTLAFPIAKKFPDGLIRGYETSPIPYFFSRLTLWLFPLPNLRFERRDFFSISLADADLVICYLYPGAMQMLKKKFCRELKPGTWVASHTFAIPGWKADKTYEADDLYKTKIYLYQVK